MSRILPTILSRLAHSIVVLLVLSVVIFAFLGNIFIPLSGTMLTIGKFTPLYGYASLARYPLTEGYLADGSLEPLWVPLAGVIAWALVFGMLATWFVKRGRDRQ